MTGDFKLAIGPELAGKTVLAALRSQDPGTSWSQLRRRLSSRHVLVNGVLCLEEARRLRAGDVLELRAQSVPPPPGRDSIRIVSRDGDLLVVDKPSGLLTERRPEEAGWPAWRKAQRPTLEEIVRDTLAPPSRRPARPANFVGLVHRLDRETSGLIALALNPRAQESLISQFREHTARRTYLAVVSGILEPQTIRTRIARDRGDGLRGSARAGVSAVTHVEILDSFDGYALIRCNLETGRTNQIRIHLSELGNPICGDGKYRGPLGAPIPDDSGTPRLALHATRLELRHPSSGQTVVFESAWPTELEVWLHRLRHAAESSTD